MTPHSILIIDDDEQVRSLFRRVLEEAGYRVTEASNGPEGLSQFRESPTALVITDLFMPKIDGLEVTMALRRESPTIKIILLTGGSREVGLLDAPALHDAPRMMKKPITIAALLEAVAQELMD